MSSVITKSGDVETLVVGPIVGSAGTPLTGLTSIKVAVFRASDSKFLDWSTMGFSAAPATLYQALTEVDAARVPGMYLLAINTSSFVGVNSNDRYFACVSQQGASTAYNALQTAEFRIGTIVDKVESNLTAPVATSAALATSTSAIEAAVTSATTPLATSAELASAVAALPAATALAVWATNEGMPTLGTTAWALHALRMALTNNMSISTPGTIILEDDSGEPFLTWTGVTDLNSAPITLLNGEPAHRPKAT